MKRSFALTVLLLAAALFVAAGPAAAARSHAAPFSVKGTYTRTLSVKGPALLANYDMATLEITGGRAGMVEAKVGGKVALTRGIYRIVMVGQARDDNVLKLLVK